MPKKRPIEEFQNSLWKLLASAEEEWIGSRNQSLTLYEKEYQEDTKTSGRKSTLSALARSISKAELVFIGDDHAVTQSRESFLFLLGRVLKHKKRIALGMEMVHIEDQKFLDLFLRGELSEQEFLKKMRYWERWGFDWTSYRKILLFAKKHKLPVIALNSESRGEDPLHRRDEKAALRISEYLGEHPGSSIFVLFGEQHISESHLPRRVDERLRREGVNARSLIVHQNSNFEDLPHHSTPRTQVFRLGERAFRVISHSPLAALSSHLEWLESGSQGANSMDREELRALLLDRIHSVSLALSVLLEQKSSVLDRFEVLLQGERKNALKLAKQAGLSHEERMVLLWEIENLPAVAIPKTPYLLLNDTSFPTVCEAAGQLLARGEDLLPPETDPLVFFFARSFRYGLGYFSSKLFDPYRTPKSAKSWLSSCDTETEIEIHRWRAEFRQFLRNPQSLPVLSSRFHELTPEVQNALCRSLGEIFGTKICRQFTKGSLTPESLLSLFYAANGPRNGLLSAFLGFLRRIDSGVRDSRS